MKMLRYILIFAACLLLWQCKPEPVPQPDPVYTGDSLFYGKSVRQRTGYLLKNVNPAYTQGTCYSYYNMGYCILGLIIERVPGKERLLSLR